MKNLQNIFIACLIMGILVVLSSCTNSEGNSLHVEWQRIYGGSQCDQAVLAEQTSDGGYIITGCTESYGAGGRDFWLVKTDSTGNERWSKTYGGPGDDNAYWVHQTTDGGYIVTGSTESFGAGGLDFWLVKTDESGQEEWNHTCGGPGNDLATCGEGTTDGGFILAGYTDSYGAGGSDIWLVKTDGTGQQQWAKTFGGASYEIAKCVHQTSDGGYIIAGYTDSFGSGDSDFWVVKVDNRGEEEWNKTFGSPSSQWANSIQETSNGGYIIVGNSDPSEGILLVKIDSKGHEEWERTFPWSTDLEVAFSVRQTTDGGYIIAGGPKASSGKGRLLKVDVNGEEEWSKTIGDAGMSVIMSLSQTSDGGYIASGMTRCFALETRSCDFWLIKLK